MADTPRSPLTREALAAFAATTGLALSSADLDAILAPTAALFVALDGLDALSQADVEPAATFRLPVA